MMNLHEQKQQVVCINSDQMNILETVFVKQHYTMNHLGTVKKSLSRLQIQKY